ncbi:MAG: hypothetical protein AAFQ36_09230 [Pseudomonadota bacterium]
MFWMFYLLMTLVIAGIIGYASERLGFTQNGFLPSIMVAVGGAFLFFVFSTMFRIGFSSPGINAVVSAVGALILLPTRYRPVGGGRSGGSSSARRRRTRR